MFGINLDINVEYVTNNIVPILIGFFIGSICCYFVLSYTVIHSKNEKYESLDTQNKQLNREIEKIEGQQKEAQKQLDECSKEKKNFDYFKDIQNKISALERQKEELRYYKRDTTDIDKKIQNLYDLLKKPER